ncbi:MAG: tetratricopeptide repeat protein, partial [Elusimicrobia bacterium]|nr:tetratricopeptide repeat protein [Elusimicrobiota bacterium]
SCSDSPELLNNLALVSMEKQKFDEALDFLNRAVTVDPINAESNYNLSIVYNKMGRSDLSQEFYDKACSLDPQYIFRPVQAGAMGGGFQIPPNIEKYLHSSTPLPGN